MSIILTNDKKKIIEILKKRNEIVVEVSQKVLYAFPKNMFSHSSEKKFFELVKKELKRFSRYQVGEPKTIKIEKL